MENRIGYLLLLWCVGILIRAVLMGTEKMMKLIIGNYLIAATCFAFGNSVHLRAGQLWATPELTFLGISYESFSHFLQNGQLTFVLILFALLVALVYTSSTIEVPNIQNNQVEKLYYILLIPLTLLSFIFALSIALMGEGLQVIASIKESVGGTFALIGEFMTNMPLRMLAHGVIVLLISSHIKLKFDFSKKSTTLPEGLEDL